MLFLFLIDAERLARDFDMLARHGEFFAEGLYAVLVRFVDCMQCLYKVALIVQPVIE